MQHFLLQIKNTFSINVVASCPYLSPPPPSLLPPPSPFPDNAPLMRGEGYTSRCPAMSRTDTQQIRRLRCDEGEVPRQVTASWSDHGDGLLGCINYSHHVYLWDEYTMLCVHYGFLYPMMYENTQLHVLECTVKTFKRKLFL